MNKTNIKQHLRRTFVALAAVGALLALPIADASRPWPTPPGAASGSCQLNSRSLQSAATPHSLAAFYSPNSVAPLLFPGNLGPNFRLYIRQRLEMTPQ
jgi:hypothetical protein